MGSYSISTHELGSKQNTPNFIKSFKCNNFYPTLACRFHTIAKYEYIQSCVNDHLQIATTSVHGPPFWGPNFNFCNIKLPLNNDHLATTAANFGSWWWLYIVHMFDCISISKVIDFQAYKNTGRVVIFESYMSKPQLWVWITKK